MSGWPQTQGGSTAWDRGLVHQLSAPARVVIESLESSALDIDEVARRLIDYSNSASEVARRGLARRRRAILNDDWATLLRAELKNSLRAETYKAVVGDAEAQLDITRNPARDIWTELAVLYKRSATRTTKDKANGEKYQRLLARSRMDVFWQSVEIALEAYNDVIIWPTVVTHDDGTKVIKHRLAAPDVVCVRPHANDPGRAEEVLLIDTFVDEPGVAHRNYVFWRGPWLATYNEKLERTDIGDDPGVNPYGNEMPFVEIHSDGASEERYWNTSTGEDLICLTLQVGRKRSCDDYTRKMSGFTQLLQWGEGVENSQQQLRHESAMLTFDISAGGGVKEVTWAANLVERATLIDGDIAAAGATRGINAERMKRTANYQSSALARLSERGLIERRARKIDGFREAEAAYYRKVCLVAKANGMTDVPALDAELLVQHAPLEYPEDPAAQIAYLEKAIALGIESAVGWVQKQNTTWTEQEARDLVQKNISDLAWVQELKSARNIPDSPTVATRSAEQNGALGPQVRDGKSPPSGTPAGEQMQGVGG